MLIFLAHDLAFLATPKTGSTAVEHALEPLAEIRFAKTRKHMTARKFRDKVRPFLDENFGARLRSVAVMRDPLEQLRSWYRYRCGPQAEGTAASARGIAFDDFVQAVLADDPPAYARTGRQHAFLTDADGNLAVDHLFAYEAQIGFRRFWSQRLGFDGRFKPMNVSPDADTRLSQGTEAALRDALAPDFDLHARLTASGGYLGPAAG